MLLVFFRSRQRRGIFMIPESYEQWVHCITVKCRIRLTADYANRRLTELRDVQQARTIKFREIYGDDHWRRVISWFERSLAASAERSK